MLVLPVLLWVTVATAQYVPPAPDVYWFKQTFNHTEANDDKRTFRQRYLVYDRYWDGHGPIYFCPGGEADVHAGYNHNGFMFQTGEPRKVLLVFPEHRFYGESLPFGPVDSYRPENIVALTIEQALADFLAILR